MSGSKRRKNLCKSFVNDAELVMEMADDVNKEFALKFIKSKIEEKALECLPDAIVEIDDILDALKQHIKPDCTDVIEGKFMALRLNKSNFTQFAKSAEELSEAYRRSLVADGLTRAKAHEMTIKKTKELCRKTARNEIVKSVIAATHFEEPKEVIAKFIVENDVARREYRETQAAKARQSNTNTNQRGGNSNRGRGNGRFQNNRYHNNGNRQYNNGQNQNQNRNHRGGYNNNYHGNQNRGRGNHNGHRGNQNNREHTIRIVSGNGSAPSGDGSAVNALHEQIYQIPFNNNQ